MKAGKLRHYVEIQNYVEVKDAYGEPIKIWEHFAYAYAEIRPLLGRENFAEKQVNSEQTHKIKIRFIAGVTATMRVLHAGHVYELIGYPVNFEERNIFLTFNAAEKYDHDIEHPAYDCSISVGTTTGTAYSLTGLWLKECTIFKAGV